MQNVSHETSPRSCSESPEVRVLIFALKAAFRVLCIRVLIPFGVLDSNAPQIARLRQSLHTALIETRLQDSLNQNGDENGTIKSGKKSYSGRSRRII